MSDQNTYECIELNYFGNCTEWQIEPIASDVFLPRLSQSEQSELTSAIIGVMVTVWLFKQLKRAIF